MTCQLYLKAGRVPAISQGKQILNVYYGFFGCECVPHIRRGRFHGF